MNIEFFLSCDTFALWQSCTSLVWHRAVLLEGVVACQNRASRPAIVWICSCFMNCDILAMHRALVWLLYRLLMQSIWKVWWHVKTGPAGQISHTGYRLDCHRWQEEEEELWAKQRSGSEQIKDWQSRAIRQWLPLTQVSRAVRRPLFTSRYPNHLKSHSLASVGVKLGLSLGIFLLILFGACL